MGVGACGVAPYSLLQLKSEFSPCRPSSATRPLPHTKQDRLHAEVAAQGLAGTGDAIEFQHLERLPLTEATFSEALRMYPPASPLNATVRCWAPLPQLLW
jgi:hypothetical protein